MEAVRGVVRLRARRPEVGRKRAAGAITRRLPAIITIGKGGGAPPLLPAPLEDCQRLLTIAGGDLGLLARRQIVRRGEMMLQVGATFAPGFAVNDNEYRLVELSSGDVERLFVGAADGDARRLLVKATGDDDDDVVVICSRDATFRVREVHTSNLQLVLRTAPSQDAVRDATVVAGMTTYLEMAPFAGNTAQALRSLLAPFPYDGEEGGGEGGHAGDAFDRLLCERLFDALPGSDAAIARALSEAGAIVVGGRYRLPSGAYLCSLFKDLFASPALAATTTLEEGDAALGGMGRPFAVDDVVALLLGDGEDAVAQEAERASATRAILMHYSAVAAGGLRTWDVARICTFFAVQLLEAQSEWEEGPFLAAWRRLLAPSPIEPSPALLGRLVTWHVLPSYDERQARRALSYFPSWRLPLDPVGLFEALFARSPRWLLDDMQPFLGDAAALPTSGVSSPADLAHKHARVSTDAASGALVVTPLLLQ